MIACCACTWTSSQAVGELAVSLVAVRHSAETGHAVRVVPMAYESAGPRRG